MRLIAFAAALLVSAGAAVADSARPQIPAQFTNLRVLPKDIARPDLVGVMRGFAMHLGVRCEHCHVGEGNDLSKFDFASDAKPPKAIARRMLTMVAAVNAEHLKGVGEPSAAQKVTCYTCHRGTTKPLTQPPAGGGLAPRSRR